MCRKVVFQMRKLTILCAVIIVASLLVSLVVGCQQQSAPTSGDLPPSFFLPEVPRISAEEVKAKLDAGANLVIVDSRSKANYEKSHIAGAISIPLGTMAERYSELNGYDEIVTYCT